ncbi:MAG: NADH-ubiquinone oxidoreductase-F iron-sulfur binding region domain-containing protein [Oscillospiraceae bacterium]
MKLLNTLQAAQERNGWLSPESMKRIAAKTGESMAQVISTASFYEHFNFCPGEKNDETEAYYPIRKAGVLLSGLDRGEYRALQIALDAPEEIIPVIKAAKLLGRSGGGFPAGDKWELVKNVDADEKYVVCNADEGEPFTGKDRALLTANPEAVIEGMAICAAAVGARRGFLYLRGEYAALKDGLQAAINTAPLRNFQIELCLGHGAYICGEETALLASLEDKRGEPRLKPPYPGTSGLGQKPTVINNVETFACVPLIIKNGAEAFQSLGTAGYSGTKLFTLSGEVKNPGVYELNAGATVRELLGEAGGLREGVTLLAIQSGGGSGRIMTPAVLDMPLTLEGCREYGANFGPASLVFLGTEENLPAYCLKLMKFFEKESCGVCVPCREGTKQMARLLDKFCRGTADVDDMQQMTSLAEYMTEFARCPMGMSCAQPVLSAIENFPERW